MTQPDEAEAAAKRARRPVRAHFAAYTFGFSVGSGIWMLKGERIVALTATEARLSDGRTYYRKG